MQRNYFSAVISCLVCAAFVFHGCQFSTAKVDEIVLCKQVDAKKHAVDKTSTFHIGDEAIHASVNVVHAPSDTKLKAIWYQYDPASKQRKEMIQSDFTVSEDSWIDFYIMPPSSGFSAGRYAVDIQLNGKLSNSLTFTIEGPTANKIIANTLLASSSTPSGELTEMYSFPSSVDQIHAQVKIKEAPANTAFKVIWYQLKPKTNKKDEIVSTDITAGGTDVLDFTFTPSAPLPVSRYSVDLFVNNTLSNTLYFAVK